MNENNQNKKSSPDKGSERGKVHGMKSDTGSMPDNLVFNEEADSYEIDVVPTDSEYVHPDPYKTAVKNGADANSDYDEANGSALDHYQDDPDKITDEPEMRIDSARILQISDLDEKLARTPEDDRDDLDEEGYPKNDAEKHPRNHSK